MATTGQPEITSASEATAVSIVETWSPHAKQVKELLYLCSANRPDTFSHCVRTSVAVKGFLGWLGVRKNAIHHAAVGALLHDIGKLWVPREILLKVDELQEEDWAQIRLHPTLGAAALQQHGLPNPVVDYALLHHERWDGKGYPGGVGGEDIPFLIRCFSVIDVFDALINRRPYRPALTADEARAVIKEGRGSQFDPAAVDLVFEWQISR